MTPFAEGGGRKSRRSKIEKVTCLGNTPRRFCGLMLILKNVTGHSLAAQWLGFSTFTAGAGVRSLVRELRPYKLHTVKK